MSAYQRVANQVTGTSKQLIEAVMADDLLGLAAELAYRFLFALFPLLIFVAALGGVVSSTLGIENPTDRAMETLGELLPAGAEETVTEQISRVLEQQSPGLLSVGLILALWAASGGVKAVMKAMNRAYDVEESRPFLRQNAVALGLTVLLGASVIGGFVLLMASQFFAEEIADLLGFAGGAASMIQAGQLVLAALLLFVGVSFLYWAAPNTTVPLRWLTPGAVLFIVAWLAATAAFGFYVGNFGSYADTYGALGGVIVLMLWFYITGLVLLVGAELNAVLAKRFAPGELEVDERHIDADEQRPRAESGAPAVPDGADGAEASEPARRDS